jgi:hypothetical protein
MNQRGKKLEPKLGLDMPFGELLDRLVRAKPAEVEESIRRAKQRRSAAAPKRKRRKRRK